MTADEAVGAACAEVAFAFENQPMWRQRMTDCGLRPADIRTAEDIRQIPPTRKADYRRNFPSGVVVRGARVSDYGVYTSQSAGTSGDRLVTVAHTWALAARMHRTLTVHPPLRGRLTELVKHRPVRYAPPNCSDVECATPSSTKSDRVLPDGTLVLPVAHDLLATPPALVDQAIDELRDWSADWVYADPTHLAFLAREHQARGLAAPDTCRAVILTYSQCTSAARRQVANFLPGVPAAEVVSMSEFGWLAMECPLGTMHLNNRSFYTELVVSERPAEPGEAADLYVTSLGDRLCPHIRYHTGDIYRLLEPCPCGHPFPAVRCEGRRNDLIVGGGGSRAILTPKELDLALDLDWIDVYRLAQVDEASFDFRFAGGAGSPPDAESLIRDLLAGPLGRDASLSVERTGYIPAERSGKFLSCVSAPARKLADAGELITVT